MGADEFNFEAWPWKLPCYDKSGRHVYDVAVDEDIGCRAGELGWRLIDHRGYPYLVGVTNLHRVVQFCFKSEPFDPSRPWIDHRDGDKRNCLRDNLRFASPRENAANRKQYARGGKRPASRWKGVLPTKTGWIVSFSWRGRKASISDDSEEVCAALYNIAARANYAEFAVENPGVSAEAKTVAEERFASWSAGKRRTRRHRVKFGARRDSSTGELYIYPQDGKYVVCKPRSGGRPSQYWGKFASLSEAVAERDRRLQQLGLDPPPRAA